MIFYLTPDAWLEKKFFYQTGWNIVCSKDMVLYLAYEWIAACWHSLRSDDTALIVLSDGRKHHKQVWPLFVKYIQIRQLIQLMRIALFKPAHYPRHARQALNCAWWLKPPPLPLPNIFSLLTALLHSNNCRFPLCKHLSLLVWTVFPSSNQNPNSQKSTSSSMASSGNTKRRSSTGSSAQSSKRTWQALSPANLLVSAAAISAPTTGMGFNFLPPLLIITMPFKFLKSVDLRTMGKELGDIPSGFG